MSLFGIIKSVFDNKSKLDYCGNHVYRDSVLERITNDYGYWAGGQWYYHIKDQWCEPNAERELAHAMLRRSPLTLEDYQGNVRAVVDQQGALKEVNNYYPYGALMGGGTVGNNQSVQPYKYGTKELDRQNGLDWYDSQARMYDPLLGRFTSIDPKTEDNYKICLYSYCDDNPILYVDPNGLVPRWNGFFGRDARYFDSESKKELTWTQVQNYITYGNYSGYSPLEYSNSISSHNITPFGLGVEWLTGKGERNRTFVSGDRMTELLKKHDHIRIVKEKISKLVNRGMLYSDRDGYSLSGIEGIPKYIHDYSTLATGGATGNLAVTYMGSYQLKWSVVSRNGNYATVVFEVFNTSTLASGTRPPVIGYTNTWNRDVAPEINKLFQSGPMSKTTQTLIWTETILLK